MTNRNAGPRGSAPAPTPEVPVSFFLKVVKSPAFREVVRLLLAALAGAASSGCGLVGLGASVSPQVAVYECQLEALSVAVPVPVAEDLVMAARAGNVEYVVQHLLSLGLDQKAIRAAAEAFHACAADDGPAEPAEPAPASLTRT